MKKLCFALFASFLAGANPAQAISTSFLKDAPVAHFNREDIDMFTKAAKRALNEAADGELREWANPKTGSAGTIQPLETTQGADGKCRTVQFTSSYKTLSASSQTNLCQQPDGNWKVPAPRKKAK